MFNNNYVFSKIEKTLSDLNAFRFETVKLIDNWDYLKCEYKTSNIIPDNGWNKFDCSTIIRGKDDHYWFKTGIRTPKSKASNKLFLRVNTGRENDWDATNPQGIVYLNEKMTQSLDTEHTDVLLEYDKDYDISVYFYTGMNDVEIYFKASLILIDERIEKLWYDIRVPYEALRDCYDKNSENYAVTLSLLERAVNIIDFQKPGSDEFFNSIIKADEYLQSEYYDKMCGNSTSVIDCVGHSHLDVAWLWTLEQTKEKAQRTFTNAIRLMEEYPEFRFMSSQPQLYKYVKEEAPEIYEQIKEKIKEGRWEIEGAMWLEADCNIPGGESLVRQILYGKKFIKDEFGVESHILWLPDVFGYSAALPQILKKCGVDHFVTSKISWNDTNRLPVDSFIWQGLDGTETKTDFITTKNCKDTSYETTYVGHIKPNMLLGTWENYKQKEYNNTTLLTYGFGDGGGGPTREMLEYNKRTKRGLPGLPKTRISGISEHLEKAWYNISENAKAIGRMPKWVGELYLEFHRGTYTSQARNKKNNRKSEFLMEKAEALSVIGMLYGNEYPKQSIDSLWENILLHQFHDILPGSSIKEVYEESERAYKTINNTGREIINNNLLELTSKIKGEGILVFNPLGFACRGIIKINNETYETDLIPALGWKVFNPEKVDCRVTVSDFIIENDYYKLKTDEFGHIVSLYDKENEREVFAKGTFGNEIQIFEDRPYNYDAWELSNYYKSKQYAWNDKAIITHVKDGNRAGLKIERPYCNSKITQIIWLYSQNRRIDFETEIDWHEHQKVVKASFPLDIHTLKATYEVQYGNVERPTTQNTSWEAAKFEVCGHKWADMSEDGYGVSILNDCKYGWSTEENIIKLTLLKCGISPDPDADNTLHSFTYSLLPHKGDYRSANTVKEAYILNQNPETILLSGKGSGELPCEYSLMYCNCDNIIIESIKRAENNDDIIIRLYDAYDRRSTPILNFGFDVSEVFLCDMLENEIENIDVTDNSIKIAVRNFEIVTLRVKRK